MGGMDSHGGWRRRAEKAKGAECGHEHVMENGTLRLSSSMTFLCCKCIFFHGYLEGEKKKLLFLSI